MGKGAHIKDLHEHIASLAGNNPDKTALMSCGAEGEILKEITFEELLHKIESAADYLHGLSLKEGDRVALAFGNSAELLILSWAAWSAGITTVPLDVKRDTAELHQYKIKLSRARMLIAQKGILKDEDKRNLGKIKIIDFSDFPKNSYAKKVEWKKGLSHEALILFTSGTTAYPKGAKLSLANLIVNAESIREWLRIGSEDRFLVNLPLHHINSTTFCLSVLLAGGSVAIPPTYSNSHFWVQVAETKSTLTSIVQSILFDQLSRGDEYSRVKTEIKLNRIQIGSAPVVAQTAEEFIKNFNIPLYQGYGQTETALRVTGVPMGLPEDVYTELVEKNSIGVPMSWADVEIADKKGKILKENEEGELVVKGDAVMEGYLGDEPAFRDGYFLTGDIGFYKKIDGQRFFYLKGRKKEIIIKGGINISPVAVENHLKKIFADISQVYVVGIADDRYGEEVGAVICWKEGIDEVSAKRRLKFTLLSGTPFLSTYETPKYIASISPDELPTTSTGKVQRTILKKKIPLEQFESLYSILRSEAYRFEILDPQSVRVSASHELYNQCWSSLVVNIGKYKKDMHKQFILVAIDGNGDIAGQIAFIRTDLDDEALLKKAYDDLLKPGVSKPNGGAFVCVSICSAGFKPKEIPSVKKIPDAEAVKKYLLEGHDPVFNFHRKTKGSQTSGAELVGVIQGGRPEDKSSLGYTMLLKYPEPVENSAINDDAPVSNQLIEAVLVLAKDIGIKDVYAYSRPGGLASFVSKLEKGI